MASELRKRQQAGPVEGAESTATDVPVTKSGPRVLVSRKLYFGFPKRLSRADIMTMLYIGLVLSTLLGVALPYIMKGWRSTSKSAMGTQWESRQEDLLQLIERKANEYTNAPAGYAKDIRIRAMNILEEGRRSALGKGPEAANLVTSKLSDLFNDMKDVSGKVTGGAKTQADVWSNQLSRGVRDLYSATAESINAGMQKGKEYSGAAYEKGKEYADAAYDTAKGASQYGADKAYEAKQDMKGTTKGLWYRFKRMFSSARDSAQETVNYAARRAGDVGDATAKAWVRQRDAVLDSVEKQALNMAGATRESARAIRDRALSILEEGRQQAMSAGHGSADTAKLVASNIADLFNTASSQTGKAAEEVKDQTKKAAHVSVDWLNSLTLDVVDLLYSAKEGVKHAAGAVYDSAKGAASDTAEGIKNAGESVFDTAKGAATGTVQGVKHAAGAVFDTAAGTAEGVRHAAGSAYDKAKDVAGAAYDTAKGAAGATYDTAKGAAGATYDTAKGAAGATYDTAKGVTGAAYDTAKGAAGATYDTAGAAYDTAKEAAGATYDTARGAAKGVKCAAEAAYDTASGAAKAAKEGAVGAAEYAADKAAEAQNQYEEYYDKAKEFVGEEIKHMRKEAGDSLIHAGEEVKGEEKDESIIGKFKKTVMGR